MSITLLIDLTASAAGQEGRRSRGVTEPGQLGDFLLHGAEIRGELHRLVGDESPAGLLALQRELELSQLVEGRRLPDRVLMLLDGRVSAEWPEPIRLDLVRRHLPKAYQALPSAFVQLGTGAAGSASQADDRDVGALRPAFIAGELPETLKKLLQSPSAAPEQVRAYADLPDEVKREVDAWKQRIVQKAQALEWPKRPDAPSTDAGPLTAALAEARKAFLEGLAQSFEACFKPDSKDPSDLGAYPGRCFEECLDRCLKQPPSQLVHVPHWPQAAQQRVELLLLLLFLCEDEVWTHYLDKRGDHGFTHHEITGIGFSDDFACGLKRYAAQLGHAADELDRMARTEESKSVTIEYLEPPEPGGSETADPRARQSVVDAARRLLNDARFRLVRRTFACDREPLQEAFRELSAAVVHQHQQLEDQRRQLHEQLSRPGTPGTVTEKTLTPSELDRLEEACDQGLREAAAVFGDAKEPSTPSWGSDQRRFEAWAQQRERLRPTRAQVLLTGGFGAVLLAGTVALGVRGSPATPALAAAVEPALALLLGLLGTALGLYVARADYARDLRNRVVQLHHAFDTKDRERLAFVKKRAEAATRHRLADDKRRRIQAARREVRERVDLFEWHARELRSHLQEVKALAEELPPGRDGDGPTRPKLDIVREHLSTPRPESLYVYDAEPRRALFSFGNQEQCKVEVKTRVPGLAEVRIRGRDAP